MTRKHWIVIALLLGALGCAKPPAKSAHKADVSQVAVASQDWHLKQR